MKSARLIQILLITITLFSACNSATEKDQSKTGEQSKYWHDIKRKVRYTPDKGNFVIKNGDRRFNRALYGSNTGFRVETGDLPEFALYLPGMGGTIKLGVISGNETKWLINAETIIARYKPGSMLYEIEDPVLGSGKLHLTVLPFYEGEGVIIKSVMENTPSDARLFYTYGGATGKKFKRDGDIGADPESVFYLKPENTKTNIFRIKNDNSFDLYFGEGRILTENERYENDHKPDQKEIDKSTIKEKRRLSGIFPENADVRLNDVALVDTPSTLLESESDSSQVLTGILKDGENFITIYNPETNEVNHSDLKALFDKCEQQRKAIAEKIKLNTPDEHINNMGPALAIAADAVWEYPSFVHGAIAWRMPLVGWRGAYAADWLGWHDRARAHFSSYAESQYREPSYAPAYPDPDRNLARQREEKGYAIFTEGYISRRPGQINKPHHYDMNLVYIDQLIRHFDWTGDIDYLKEMWPVIERHLDWEKRNFDPDGDGLYNSYASIWASDALEYNGGGVAHSSAYNYYAFKRAAELAELIGKDGSEYEKESLKIKQALDAILWLPEKGRYAEYKDDLGEKRLHSYPGVWSVYHLMDSEVPDPFRSYQMLNFIKNEIPHIPVNAEGIPTGKYHTISTTNWMPYTWSVNNVALAESLHTSLAYWQAGRKEDAFDLWKSALMESMHLGASPGNFQQLSFYDAMRGELYRDFADPIGVAARTLVEGLFGVKPELLKDRVVIKPGFPKKWEFAHLETPDLSINYKQKINSDHYIISNNFNAKTLLFKLNARKEKVKQITLNGKAINWNTDSASVGHPEIQFEISNEKSVNVEIQWEGNEIHSANELLKITQGKTLPMSFGDANLISVNDPQEILSDQQNYQLKDDIKGHKTLFFQLQQGNFTWWEPVDLFIQPTVQIEAPKEQNKNEIAFNLVNNLDQNISGQLLLNGEVVNEDLKISPHSSVHLKFDNSLKIKPGTNIISLVDEDQEIKGDKIINWDIEVNQTYKPVDLTEHFNDEVTNIFKNEYRSPRSPYPTLQIPVHGLGDWCSYKAYMEIDDTGLRKLAGEDEQFTIPTGIPFKSPSDNQGNNIVFTSIWDNYPKEVNVPLDGNASHAYLLMAGTTNPMQSRFDNGVVIFEYVDGTSDSLVLRNPETWWPIEQDYFIDGYAFDIDVPKPVRVHLKTGWVGREFKNYTSIDHFTNYAIEGGAATVLDIPLESDKKLKNLKLRTTANDVVIGLMSLTLVN